MPKYSALLEGSNFPIIADGKTELLGFYTTRVVKASNAREAEEKAIDLIRNDPDLLKVTENSSNTTPRIFIEEIRKAKWWCRTGGSGYTFFDMEK